jgi:DNA-binding CsgD family transcriptional regulator
VPEHAGAHRVEISLRCLGRCLDIDVTPRETEVLIQVARGLSNREIASQLFLGEATIKTYVGNILMKLGCRDRVQAVVAAYEARLVEPRQRSQPAGHPRQPHHPGARGHAERSVMPPPDQSTTLTSEIPNGGYAGGWPCYAPHVAPLSEWPDRRRGDKPPPCGLDRHVRGEALLGAAVVNNASWCDAVCRSHGYPGVFSAHLWISARHDLQFYPNAISLRPDVTAPEAMAARELSRRYAVKDSFARLDLAAEGLTLLFEAEWIAYSPAPAGPGDPGLSWDTVTEARDLSVWERAWAQRDSADRPLLRPGLLADPRCAILACRCEDHLAAGVITYAAGGVTGISNLFGAGLAAGQLWPSALEAVAARRPDLPIVGYEHGTDLASARQAGCRSLGPLRVWVHDPAP